MAATFTLILVLSCSVQASQGQGYYGLPHSRNDINRFQCSEKYKARLEREEDLVESAKDVNIKAVGDDKNDDILGATPESFKILLENWVAQWDPQYRAWFYYNIETDFPQKSLNQKLLYQSNSATQYRAVPPAQSKLLESSKDNFFGHNTKFVKQRGLIGGLADSLSYLYESVIQDYVESVYTDVIEGYTIATIKLIGWFVFGSLLVVKGAIINHYATSARSFGRALAGSHYQPETASAKFSFLENLDFTFPVEESVLDCYQDRPSCLDNDFNKEVEHLLANIYELRNFIIGWLEFGEKIGNMATEGELEL